MHFCRFISKPTTVVLFTLLATNAFGDTFSRGLYFGGSFSKHRFADSFGNLSLTGAVFKAGYDIFPFFAIEGHAGATITSDNYEYDNGGQLIGEYNLSAEHGGIYARGNLRLMNVTIYGLLGYNAYTVIVNEKMYGNYDVSYSTNESGFSYGAGLDLFGAERTALSLNWMKMIDEEDEFGDRTNVNAVYLGITYYLKPQSTTHPLR